MQATLRTRSGGTVAVDPRNLDSYVTVENHKGVWEKQIHDALERVVKPGNVVYDIGANAGILTIDLAAHLRGDVTIIAFEPIPSLAHAVALSASINGFGDRIRVYDVMLGRREGEASLFVPRHSIHASARSREAGAVELRRRVMTLDGLIAARAIPPPDVVKIDVEGGEMEVFAGATNLLKTRPPFIIFEADMNMVRFGYTRADLLNAMTACARYTFMYVTPRGLIEAKDPTAELGDDFNNMIAVPPGVALRAHG